MNMRDEPRRLENTAGGSENAMGQRMALAGAALVLSLASFVNLFNMEKSALAIIFAWLALRGAAPLRQRRFAAWTGLLLGAVHIVLTVALLVVFREQVLQFFEMLERLQQEPAAASP